jgi:NADP-dependent 3-hydroxy acid dehydrogenase YdfG
MHSNFNNYFILAILPSMIHHKSGHIIAISSVQGKIAVPFR